MRRAVLCGVLFVAACSKKPDGLPPATEWSTSPAEAVAANAATGSDDVPHLKPPPGMTTHGGNPHAGMDIGGGDGDPHAGLDVGGEGDGAADPSNPHAGLGMATGTNPHGAGGSIDVTKMGLAAPDPDRAIDPNHKVSGMITIDGKVKDKVKAGTAIFLIVKRAGADGNPSGPPLAVDKLTWSDGGVPFSLTDEQAMVAGTELAGDVIVMARYDQDSDAISKQPGDVTGQLRLKIPAVNVKIALDTVLP
jgi:hypothetical protein